MSLSPPPLVEMNGIRSLVPHFGQTPFLPARNDLTFSLCPFGQRNLIPIVRRVLEVAPNGPWTKRRSRVLRGAQRRRLGRKHSSHYTRPAKTRIIPVAAKTA